jgi:5'-deoxynucleotidase YfbR-like HD superfamily hydrolase
MSSNPTILSSRDPNYVSKAANADGWIETFTRRKVTPMDLSAEMICIEDIAHSLSRLCRYNGHTAGFLSVAEHCVHVSKIVAETHPEFALEGLLHDAAEAYLGDMVRPLKHLPEMQVFRDADERAEAAIAGKFELTYPWPKVVHDADRIRLMVEIDTLRHSARAAMTPDAAKGAFLATYSLLRETRPIKVA